ncbi:MAG: aminodeoxychorismate lyase [Gammaproteobacteria bacterium]
MSTWLINGTDSTIAPGDRGLAYGDGLFETMAMIDGKVRFFSKHLERLLEGCRRLGIDPPDRSLIMDDLSRLYSTESRCVAKLIVTRGVGGRGYRPDPDAESTRIVGIHPWPDYPVTNYSDGINVRLCDTRLAENSLLAGIKHLNRLEQVMARAEWTDDRVAEGLMLDVSGRVVSGTMTNLFSVRGDTLTTPNLQRCGVAGVMRSVVMDLAVRDGIKVVETDVSPEQLLGSDEVFVTNAVLGIWPVKEIGGRCFDSFETTRQFMQRLEEISHE